MTGAANIFKTELYAGTNWGIQSILGMTSIVNIVAKNMPWNYANIETRMMYERVGQDINAISNYSRQFFRDKAPYKEAFDATGFVLDVATLTSGVKSISNIGKNLPGTISIGQLSLSGTGINIPVLCLDGVASIATAGEISSIAASGSVLYKAASNGGSTRNSNRSFNENIDANDSKAVDKPKVDNMNEFFEDSFGSSIKGSLKRTGSNFQS